MDCGDIHIKNTCDGEDGELRTVAHKMKGPIEIVRWSGHRPFKCGVVVQSTHIAVTKDNGETVERIASKQPVTDCRCGTGDDGNVLSIVSSRNVIVHGISDESRRKLLSFDE